MKNTIQITIPKPCHENWQEMTVVDKGKFCSSCQKTVIDFTSVSDREIINIFNKSNNLCGRFTASQLNRDIFTPKEKSSIWMAASAAVVSFFTIGNQEVKAQEVVKIEQTDKKTLDENLENNSDDERIITGVVSDSIGTLPGANVIIQGTNKSTQTDVDGKYSIKAKTGDVLVFSFVGFIDSKLKIEKNQDIYNPKLYINIEVISGRVGMIIIKRTFFGRIFHEIGTWFR